LLCITERGSGGEGQNINLNKLNLIYMSQKENEIKCLYKQSFTAMPQYFTKEEVICLVEEAYTPKAKSLIDWLTEYNMPKPVIGKFKATAICNPRLYPSLTLAVREHNYPYLLEEAAFWEDVSRGKVPTLTVKDWIDTLPPHIRAKAIGNTPPVMLNNSAKSLFIALDQAFDWANTKEGGPYWASIACVY
jgi:hypothetical protein